MSAKDVLDIIVVGGGINGAGIAADASGRSLKVGLYEAEDFASATSSASSKLIHGGLRYLEHYEFRLVGEALAEREVLLQKAKHIAMPMRFRLPHRPFLRPAWMIRIGLFLYDHLGKRKTLKGSHGVDFRNLKVLKDEITKGFEYSDCWVDDARLVVLNIKQAEANGAEVKNYCRVEAAQREGKLWKVTLFDQKNNTRFERYSKALVNAAGPWVSSFIKENMETKPPYGIRLIKGSHIVVPKIHDESCAYILQNDDKRIVFVIPYLEDYSLIGTTDVEYKGDPRSVVIDEQEIEYLVNIVNKYFIHQIRREDVIWTYSGVRPLCDDESDSPQAITRDYTLALQQEGGEAPLLSIFGGKLTTYRKLAESAMKELSPFFEEMGESWTANGILLGSENYQHDQIFSEIKQQCAWLDDKTIRRYCNQYGTQVKVMLRGIEQEQEMGVIFAPGVYQCEMDYLLEHEYVHRVEDVLWRRTKLGISLSEAEKMQLNAYITQKVNG